MVTEANNHWGPKTVVDSFGNPVSVPLTDSSKLPRQKPFQQKPEHSSPKFSKNVSKSGRPVKEPFIWDRSSSAKKPDSGDGSSSEPHMNREEQAMQRAREKEEGMQLGKVGLLMAEGFSERDTIF